MQKQYRWVFGANNTLNSIIISSLEVFNGRLEETVTINKHFKVYTVAFNSAKDRQAFRKVIPLTQHAA